MRARHWVPSVLLAALLFSGCGGIADPSKNQVESFSSTVPVGGSGPPHSFSVGKTGELSVRIIALSPTPSVVVGMVYGQPASGTCGVLTSSNFVGLNRDQFQFQIQKGSYCIQVYDAGYLAVAQTYTVQVSHP